MAQVFRPGHDWFFFYYRDRAASLALGITPLEMLLQAVGAKDEPQSGARQMPSHFSSPKLHIANTSSPTGTQFLQACGCAEAGLYAAQNAEVKGVPFESDEVVVVTTGDGTTSEGEFWESINTACNRKLPVVYVVEDNGYAISVPVEVNTAGGSISKLLASFPNLLIREVDGCDPVATVEAYREAAARAGPQGTGARSRPSSAPTVTRCRTTRRTTRRRTARRRANATRRDVPRDPRREGIVEQEVLDAIEAARRGGRAAVNEALGAGAPSRRRRSISCTRRASIDLTGFATDPVPSAQPTTMVDLLNACMKDEMRRHPRIVVFGQDVADASRDESLAQVKGKGGVFKVTWGLQKEFGGLRVFNSPLAEANIVGRAIGMALRGIKPVVEIQFFDYIWPAYMQIRDELVTMRWRSGNTFSCPIVIRVAYGGYITGARSTTARRGRSVHGESRAACVCPRRRKTRTGCCARRPLRRSRALPGANTSTARRTTRREPGPELHDPFGKASCVREGRDLTVVTYGATVYRTLRRPGRPRSAASRSRSSICAR
jgi:2-oxoisovalerate dehydrogenase E1 component